MGSPTAAASAEPTPTESSVVDSLADAPPGLSDSLHSLRRKPAHPLLEKSSPSYSRTLLRSASRMRLQTPPGQLMRKEGLTSVRKPQGLPSPYSPANATSRFPTPARTDARREFLTTATPRSREAPQHGAAAAAAAATMAAASKRLTPLEVMRRPDGARSVLAEPFAAADMAGATETVEADAPGRSRAAAPQPQDAWLPVAASAGATAAARRAPYGEGGFARVAAAERGGGGAQGAIGLEWAVLSPPPPATIEDRASRMLRTASLPAKMMDLSSVLPRPRTGGFGSPSQRCSFSPASYPGGCSPSMLPLRKTRPPSPPRALSRGAFADLTPHDASAGASSPRPASGRDVLTRWALRYLQPMGPAWGAAATLDAPEPPLDHAWTQRVSTSPGVRELHERDRSGSQRARVLGRGRIQQSLASER